MFKQLLALVMILMCGASDPHRAGADPLAHTFSIVARDAATGEILELPFWQAVTLASVGRWAEAQPIFKAVFAKKPVWAELVGRLPAAGLLPNDPALVARIQALAPSRAPRRR